MKNRLLAVFVALIALGVASPLAAGPISVSLVPSAPNAAPGSTVTVSVNMVVDSAFTMTALNEVIFYDPSVFTYVDPSVVQGGLLQDDWAPLGAAATPGTLIVGAFDLTGGETLSSGAAGTLFTFTLLVKATASLGPSVLSWGNGSFLGDGFGYGDENWADVLVPSTGTTINVQESVPDPGSSLVLFGIGLLGLRAWQKRWK